MGDTALFPLLDSLFQDPMGFFRDALYRVPAVLIALILHEWSHGFVAYKLGDPTARIMGRLSLNPLKHLDPMGTLLMFFIGFGWAKPVPINPANFKRPRRDDFLVSIAGITMNVLLYLLFITSYYFLYIHQYTNMVVGTGFWPSVLEVLFTFLPQVAIVNLSFAIFNFLPIPPLDGSHIFNDLIFKGKLFASQRTQQIGMVVLMIASFSGWLSKGMNIVINAALDGTFSVLSAIAGL